MPWRFAFGMGSILPNLVGFNGKTSSLLAGSTTTNVVSGLFTVAWGVTRYLQWRQIHESRKVASVRRAPLPMPPPGFEGEWDWDRAVAVAFGDPIDEEKTID